MPSAASASCIDKGTGVIAGRRRRRVAAGAHGRRAGHDRRPPADDGAIGSATNADVALGRPEAVERAVVIAALPLDPGHARLAELWNDALRAELWELDAAGVETYIVRASPADLDVMGPDMMSGGGAPLAVRAGRPRRPRGRPGAPRQVIHRARRAHSARRRSGVARRIALPAT